MQPRASPGPGVTLLLIDLRQLQLYTVLAPESLPLWVMLLFLFSARSCQLRRALTGRPCVCPDLQGANAKQTNRSNDGAKGLIKSGKEAAMVELVIANKGSDAYKPELFGDAIIIERKITKARQKACVSSSSARHRGLEAGSQPCAAQS